MRIIDEESKESILYRNNVIANDQRSVLPKIIGIMLAIIMALCVYYAHTESVARDTYGLGNPYKCAACKAKGYACSKHKNYDSTDEFESLVYLAVSRYSPDEDETHQKYNLYGYGNEYDTGCDFCNEAGSECYSCEVTRKYIYESIEELLNSSVFKSQLCDTCWAVGYPVEDKCYNMMTHEIKEMT